MFYHTYLVCVCFISEETSLLPDGSTHTNGGPLRTLTRTKRGLRFAASGRFYAFNAGGGINSRTRGKSKNEKENPLVLQCDVTVTGAR